MAARSVARAGRGRVTERPLQPARRAGLVSGGSPEQGKRPAAPWPARRKFAGVNSNSSYGVLLITKLGALETSAPRTLGDGDLVDGDGTETQGDGARRTVAFGNSGERGFSTEYREFLPRRIGV